MEYAHRAGTEAPVLAGWSLACPACGHVTDPGVFPRGCPACLERGEEQALLVRYEHEAPLPPAGRTAEGIWKFSELLPGVGSNHRVTLGEGETPLVQVPLLVEESGCERLYLKMESQNPTAAHKDRFHAVSLAVGRALGYEAVVSSSTGNHGLSMTAYAAAHGMQSVVIANERMPTLLQRAIRFLGGLPLLAPESLGSEILSALVEQDGWYPSTTTWPLPMANPYGVEGYKTIGLELYRALGDRMPDLVFVPTAAGDGLLGIWRAIDDLRRLGLPNVDVRLCPCQPAGAAPLVRALDHGLEAVPYFEGAYSRALSIGDPISGRLALRAVRETGGFGVAVTDEAILAAGRLLAQAGLLVEPASAASVAGALQALREQPELRQRTIVCVVTSSGLKWLDDYAAEEPLPAGMRVETVVEARAAAEAHVAAAA